MIGLRLTPFIIGLVLSCVTAFTQVPSDAEIRKIPADRVGAESFGIGIVVGVIDANGRGIDLVLGVDSGMG